MKLRRVPTPLSAARPLSSTARPKTPPATKAAAAASMLRAKAHDTAAADDRQLPGYTKLKKLGVGGCGTVWQVARTEPANEPDRQVFALKQIPKDDGAVVSGVVETRVGLKLFPLATVVRDKLLQGLRQPAAAAPSCPAAAEGTCDAPPVDNGTYITPLLAVVETRRDLWLVFEQGGETLHNALFDIRGEFVQGSRTYRIGHRPLYLAMRENVVLLKTLLRQLLLAIQTLAKSHLVHADIKPDNILVRHAFSAPDSTAQLPVAPLHNHALSAKLIDFGSAFSTTSPKLSSAHTPEYVPPDILELVRTKHQSNHVKAYFDAHCRPHSFDMWSLGCVFLEIACGVPLWLPYKARVGDGGNKLVTGPLAATGRNADKIATRQLHVVANLRQCIRDCGGMNVDSRRWTHGVDLMQRMLEIDPAHRIAPTDALAHPFLASLIAPTRESVVAVPGTLPSDFPGAVPSGANLNLDEPALALG